ncbi:BTAD domain-containing putative transcriptional regulator [Kribbella hippodromi]|uniref:BTAD domain-containing putative transcriptional regulator n=2 Tax=Kribbella hippodromi TaxID=434347 RepID=A0ABP4PMG9_9ACTN
MLSAMEFRLLGPVQIWSKGEQLPLRRRQERLLLAVLLLEPGKPVPAERLIDLLWPDALPANPRRALQVYMSRLRAVLDTKVTSGTEGYAILAEPAQVDAERFKSLVDQARRQEDLERRSKLLTEALQLWRGPALAGVTAEDVRRRLCGSLEEARWAAEELRLSTELALGHHQELLPDLAQLTALQPERETFAVAHMLALYRSGRQADALAVYGDLVRHLDEELGVEPGTEARELQVAILRQDPVLDLATTSGVPRELPADVGVLLGRDDLLAEAAQVLLDSGRQSGVPAAICLYGAAGTGKSAAAVRLGHRLASEYPDGQLFVRLQDVAGDAVPPDVVLGRLLRSLGLDSGEIPDELDARSALLRSRLADRAVLMVFDDAIDAGQLRPLLPANGSCAVITTSRRPLLGLEDALHRELEPLPDETSAELLGLLSGLGADRVSDLVPHCAGLPLALRIVGARLAVVREDVGHVVKTLADEALRLDYLVAGDRAVRASLDLTLRVADSLTRDLFARLALVGADEFAAWVAAPLLDLDEDAAAVVFDNLVALGLVQQRRINPPRYGLHGMVRALAVEQYAAADDDELRYLDTVLRLVTIADEHIDHAAVMIELDRGGNFVLPATEELAAAGASWLDTEGPVVRAAVERALPKWPRLGSMLALRFAGYLAVRDDREVRRSVLDAARAAAAAAGELELEADLCRCLFGALAQAGAPVADLRPLTDRAVALAEQLGNPALRMAALSQQGWLTAQVGDFAGMSRVGEEMLAVVDAHPEAEPERARALDQVGGGYFLSGRIDEGRQARREAAALSPSGTRLHAIRLVLLAESLLAGDDLGAAHVPELTAVLAEAREIVERIGDELGIAHVDNTEAQLLVLTGDLAGAETLLRHAADILTRRPDSTGEGANAAGWARLHVAAGRIDEARQVMDTAIGNAPATGVAQYELAMHSRALGLDSASTHRTKDPSQR